MKVLLTSIPWAFALFILGMFFKAENAKLQIEVTGANERLKNCEEWQRQARINRMRDRCRDLATQAAVQDPNIRLAVFVERCMEEAAKEEWK